MHSHLTLVSGHITTPLTQSHIHSAYNFLTNHNYPVHTSHWLHPDKAADIIYDGLLEKNDFSNLRQIMEHDFIDIFTGPAHNRRKSLLLADMDATIIVGETLDELAETIGLKDKIAAITERAMRGEIDFQSALTERVAMLEGLPESALQKTLESTRLNAGAKTTIRTLRHHGVKCYLVSGGFTFFTSAIAEQCGFHGHHGNQLDIRNGQLTGTVIPPILDKYSKLEFLHHYREILGLSIDQTMTVGDGANDIPMLAAAGYGVGYYPKPAVQDVITNCIIHTDLTSLLYIQGFSWQDIVT